MAWTDFLLPASWRGLSFVVTQSDVKPGRRVAIHEYPWRDSVWVEDMGKGVQRFAFTGFIVNDFTVAEEMAFIAAANQPGPGMLIHPALGVKNVALIDFTTGRNERLGRVLQLNFEFVETTGPTFPMGAASTIQAVLAKAVGAVQAVAADFYTVASPILGAASAVVGIVYAATSAFTSLASAAAYDPAGAIRVAASVPGNFGRYAMGLTDAVDENATVASALTGLQERQDAVAVACAAAVDTATSAASTDLPPAIMVVVGGLRTVFADPAEQVRILESIADFARSTVAITAGLGALMEEAEQATTMLFRRSVAIEMARAAAAAVPGSYEEAADLRVRVLAALDAAVTEAGDVGDDATYQALRDLRTAVAADLEARGASLAHLRHVVLGDSLPALAVAHRLYQDATRADDLVRRAGPVHPAFMPNEFDALSP